MIDPIGFTVLFNQGRLAFVREAWIAAKLGSLRAADGEPPHDALGDHGVLAKPLFLVRQGILDSSNVEFQHGHSLNRVGARQCVLLGGRKKQLALLVLETFRERC